MTPTVPGDLMHWQLSHRFDPPSVRIADRHYSRQKPGTPQFVRPGKTLVLRTADGLSVWATSWQDYVDHDWPGAWECVIFRREGGAILASDLIREAVACTRWKWGDPPVNGYITFIDPNKTRHKRDPGRCFLRAGFIAIWQRIKDRRLLLQMPREVVLAIPPAAPLGSTVEMFAEVAS